MRLAGTMRREVGKNLMPIVLALGCSLSLVNGQAQRVRVNLGSASFAFDSESGNSVSLPLSLALPGDEARVARVRSEIVFPVKYLTFVKASSRVEGVRIETKMAPDAQDAAKSRLAVEVSAAAGRLLPPGPVAQLEFEVSAMTPDGVLKLENFPEAYGVDEPSRPLDNVAGDAGSIEVSTRMQPVAGCFFYMH